MPTTVEASKAVMRFAIDDKEFRSALDRTQLRLNRWARNLTAAGLAISGFGSASLAAFKPAIDAAAKAEEAANLFRVVFKEQEDAARSFANSLADNLGRSRTEVADFIATSQSLFVPLGFDEQNARAMSQVLTQLALDVGSLRDVADADVMNRFQSALLGNSEAVRRLGINTQELAVKERLAAEGINKVAQEISFNERVIGRFLIILEASKNAFGDAINTVDSFTNSMRRLRGQTINALERIGGVLINFLQPYAVLLADLITSVSKFLQANDRLILGTFRLLAAMSTLGAVVTSAGLSLKVLSLIMSGYAPLVKNASAAFKGLVAAMSLLGGIVPVIQFGLIALSATLIDWRRIFGGMAKAVKDLAIQLKQSLGPAFEFIRSVVSASGIPGLIRAMGQGVGELGIIVSNVASVFQDGFTRMTEVSGDSMEAIRNALRQGNLELAAKAAMAGLELAWAEGVFSLQSVWSDFTTFMKDSMTIAITEIEILFKKAFFKSEGFISKGYAGIFKALASVLPSGEGAGGVLGGLKKGFEDIAGVFSGVGDQFFADGEEAVRKVKAQQEAALQFTQRQQRENDNARLRQLQKQRDEAQGIFDLANDPYLLDFQGVNQNNFDAMSEQLKQMLKELQGGNSTSKKIESQGTFFGTIASRLFPSQDVVAKKQLAVQEKQLTELQKIDKGLREQEAAVLLSTA